MEICPSGKFKVLHVNIKQYMCFTYVSTGLVTKFWLPLTLWGSGRWVRVYWMYNWDNPWDILVVPVTRLLVYRRKPVDTLIQLVYYQRINKWLLCVVSIRLFLLEEHKSWSHVKVMYLNRSSCLGTCSLQHFRTRWLFVGHLGCYLHNGLDCSIYMRTARILTCRPIAKLSSFKTYWMLVHFSIRNPGLS